MKYNINKDKEFSSFDCSPDAMTFFDTKCEGYILDTDSIIDIDQGIPLYYYKTGMNNLQKQYIMSGTLDKGARFCSRNIHFTVRNRVYLPYNYLSLIAIQNNKGKVLDKQHYNPEVFFCIDGNTQLHLSADNFKDLEFMLSTYEANNPKLINLLLLKNRDPNGPSNVLELAMQSSNARCVNLILDKLSKISMNNIHSLKNMMSQLLEYNGFEAYLSLCFFTTQQMENKVIFRRKSENQDDGFFIAPHDVSFIDKKFYENFEDLNAPPKPVKIRSLDAGWLLKYQEGPGQDFMQKLSESDNMKYFEIDTIQLIVNYQWKIMKPQIILFLFVPFLINMLLFNFYCLFLFEDAKDNEGFHNTVYIYKFIVQILLLIFSIHTFYVEFKQITFHREAYLHSFWNILDLTVVVMAPIIVIMDLVDFDNTKIRHLMAFCNLTFYLRFFYFLRIFDSSAHLVRTIIEITYDIRNFLFVFMVGVIGFGASFFILSNNNQVNAEPNSFITSFSMSFIYSYRLSLGDFDTDAFEDSYNTITLWVLFIICSMFTAIIMLNMLVAIMGESFNRVNEQSECQRVREHLQLIVENDFLIDRKKHFGNVKYLVEIQDDIEDDLID